jgi:hypothetical protein
MTDFTSESGWEDKTNFLVGMPEDLSELPELYYQALLGNVYTLQRWPDGSTARGEMALAELESRVGGPVKEGWYDAAGKYLGLFISLD